MELNGLSSGCYFVFGIFALVGLANLMDLGFRRMAESKAQRAEAARYSKWGLPSTRQPEEIPKDDHLWHF
jgi:hypothetical protein